MAAQARGVAYLTTTSPIAARQTAGAEAASKSRELLDTIESPLVLSEIEAAQNEKVGRIAEVVVELGEDYNRSDNISNTQE